MLDEKPSDDPTACEPPLSDLGRALFGVDTGAPPQLEHLWPSPSPHELQALLPQYEILSMIGRGGMGTVYLASQPALDRLVAIKILSAELDAYGPGFNQRFKNEARAMAKLCHPGIVALHDFGETSSGLHYIVMEFIEGTNVQQMIIASRRLHTEHALAIVARVCDALHYAHERGIIHRDIKPANIIVGYDGSVKVADFGLAKISATEAGAHQLTRSGTTLGTPHYIAPEALIPGTVSDGRADIYATGVMLYHMLTGKLPQGLFELPSIQVPGLDPRLDTIIARAMREDRELRYPNAAAMRADLDSILTQPIPQSGTAATLPPEARPQRPGFRTSAPIHQTQRPEVNPKTTLWIWAVVPALFFAIFGAWLYFHLASPPDRIKNPPLAATPARPLPSQATKDQPFINSLGMKFVPVPGTKILMCVHETRQRDYAVFTSIKPTGNEDWCQPFPPGFDLPHKEDHPVSKISWFDAIAFTDWLTEKEGLKYRLPTDEEWSAGVGLDAFPWGNDWPPVKPVGNYKDKSTIGKFREIGDLAIQGYNDHFILTSPVMSFPANHLGLHDMGGNVWEWCMTSSPANPGSKILRGAAWNRGLSKYLFSMARTDYASAGRLNVYGFRVVIELAESTPATSGEAATSAPTPPLPPATKDQPFSAIQASKP